MGRGFSHHVHDMGNGGVAWEVWEDARDGDGEEELGGGVVRTSSHMYHRISGGRLLNEGWLPETCWCSSSADSGDCALDALLASTGSTEG